MRRSAFVAALALLALPARSAFAQAPADVVGNVGLHSVDVPTADLATLESALDRAISINAATARAKTATLSLLDGDPDISAKRADARRAMEAGINDMKTFQLDAAETEFDKAVAFWTVAHGAILDPSDVSKLYLQRAKLAQIRHQPQVMKEEFERALAVHPTKQLDPTQFSPDAMQVFQQALEASSSTPPQPASGAALADIGRRTSLHWICAGDVRKRGASYAVTLSIADVVARDGKSETFELPSGGAGEAALETAVAKLFVAASIPGPASQNLARANGMASGTTTVAAAGTAGSTGAGTSGSTGHPVPPNALPTPRPTPRPGGSGEPTPIYQRWYVWAAVAGAVGVGVVAASQTGGSKSGGSSGPPGITLVVTK